MHSKQKTTLEMLSKSKTVGYFAGFALLFNQMTGPGVPFTATNFQTPGLLMTLLSYVIFCMVSGFSMLFLIQAMQAIPGNSQFQGHVEYSTLLNFYFGHSMHIFGQLVLYCALQSNAIQSLNLIAQSVDYLLVDSIGRSCGLTMGFKWMCVNVPSQEYASPFGDVYMLFTYGFLITLLIAIPFAFYDLDSSATITVISFGLTVIMGLQWISAAGLNGFEWDRVPVVQPVGPTYGQVMGTVMLNLACCTVIPSWINIKNKDVPAQDVIWTSIFMTSFYYICIGFFLAMGFDIDASGNVLNAILTQGVPALLCKITVGMFSIVMLLPGIPISFLVSRNNLVQNKITSPLIATLLAFVVPFFVCIPLQTGYNLIKFQTWTSLTVVSACNFVFPFLLYFKCRSFRKAFNRDRMLTKHQLDLLCEIHSNSEDIQRYIDLKRASASPVDDGVQLTIRIPSNLTVRSPTFVAFQNTHPELEPSSSSDALLSGRRPSGPGMLRKSAERRPLPMLHIPESATHKNMSSLDTLSDSAMISLRYQGGYKDYIPLSSVTFVDPKEMGLASILDQDIPEPTPVTDTELTHEPLEIESDARQSMESNHSLPRHPHFVTPAFRSVPSWIKIPEQRIAKVVMAAAILFSFANVIFNLVVIWQS